MLLEGEPGSCFSDGDNLDEGEVVRFLEAKRTPVMEVGAWEEVGGLPRPGKAPESESAGFCTAII